jgi:TolB-like protein/Flp pilus assembly protein TadD
MATSPEENSTYTFGEFTLDLSRGALTKGGKDIKLRPQSFRVLRHLVERHGKLVAKEELLDAVWSDTIVTVDSLTQCIIDIRKAIGDSTRSVLRTVPRRGYIFDAEVTKDGHTRRAESASKSAVAPSSVAVLPFANMSPDPEQDYFCEGMAEELINAIGRIRGLKVAGRASTFRFRDTGKDLRDVGRALNVRAVLDGSVRVAGGRLRVTVHLVDMGTGYEIWTERYDCEMKDVFDIQDEIVESVVNALRSKLVAAGRPVREHHETNDLEAYHLYLRGQHNWYRREKDSLAKAASYFEQAAERDPSYVLAHVGAANAYTSLALYGARYALTAPKATEALERALALDEERAEVRAAKGLIHHWLEGEPQRAEEEFVRALEKRPDFVMARCWHSFVLSDVGRHAEAIASVREALEQDPLSPYTRMSFSLAFLKARRIGESVAEFEKALALDAHFLSTLWMLGSAYVAAGRGDDAIAIYERAVPMSGRASAILGMLAWAYACGDRRAEAEALIAELRLRMHGEYVAPNFLVWSLGALGETDQAFEWFERSCAEKDVSIRMLYSYPFYDCLRSDPRLDDMVGRYGWVARLAPDESS